MTVLDRTKMYRHSPLFNYFFKPNLLVTHKSEFHTCNILNKTQIYSKKKRSETAKGWLLRQLNDPYVAKSRTDNYRCRSAYKLLEIDDKYGVLRPGGVVVDCGAAPGSWTQVAVRRTNAAATDKELPQGLVIGVDLQSTQAIEGATILHQADFRNPSTQQQIRSMLHGRRVNTVLSDMAPSATGLKSMDHELIIELCKSALKFSVVVLDKGGVFLCKLWQGDLQQGFEVLLKQCFNRVRIVKPNASRADSAEIFYLAQDFKGTPKR